MLIGVRLPAKEMPRGNFDMVESFIGTRAAQLYTLISISNKMPRNPAISPTKMASYRKRMAARQGLKEISFEIRITDIEDGSPCARRWQK